MIGEYTINYIKGDELYKSLKEYQLINLGQRCR